MRSPRVYTWFSEHAYDRVQERLTMDSDDVGDLLDFDLAVKIGEEKETNRVHRLFYSHDDRQCFVAIQDEKTKMLITILPVDYYETLVAKIPPACLQDAEGLVSTNAGVERVPSDGQASAVLKPLKFRITGIIAQWGKDARRVNFGAWPVGELQGTIGELLQNVTFIEAMKQRAQSEIKEGEYVESYGIRLGKKGEWWFAAADEEGRPIPK